VGGKRLDWVWRACSWAYSGATKPRDHIQEYRPWADPSPFLFSTAKRKMILRHLLTHSSGLAYDTLDPLLTAWRALRNEPCKANAPIIDPGYKTPLLFEPGEGWVYSPSIEYVSLLVTRITGMSCQEFVTANILIPMNMTSTTFDANRDSEIAERMLQKVSR
jgi:CubicO group peptidase (beta-lactamase class C family)